MRGRPARVALDHRNRLRIDGELVKVDSYDRKSNVLEYLLVEHDEGAEWRDVRRIDDLKHWECSLIERSMRSVAA